MHILILASFYPSDIRPYTGILFQGQARAFHHAEQQVGVLVLPRIRETLHIMKSKFPPEFTRDDEDFPVYRMHRGWFPRVFPEVCAWLTHHHGVRVFQSYMDEHGKPDVIHAHNVFYGGYLASQLGEKFDIPTVVTERSSNHISGRIFLPGQKRIVRKTFEKIDWVTAISASLRNVLLKYYPDIDVVDNVVDVEAFDFKIPPIKQPFVFASVGTLTYVKNFPLLIMAFKAAFGDDSNHLLKIGGEGRDRPKLEMLIRELGMESQIELLGRLSHDEVKNLFQDSHVIVSSSHIETFGATLIEAMACGRPVIATRSGGPEGFVNEKNGLLVANNDVEALASGMRTLVNTYDQYNLKDIREFCVNRFSETAITDKLLNRYEALCDVRSSDRKL